MNRRFRIPLIVTFLTLSVSLSHGDLQTEPTDWQTILRVQLAAAPKYFHGISNYSDQTYQIEVPEAVGQILEERPTEEVLAVLRILASEPIDPPPKAVIRARILHDWSLVPLRHLTGVRTAVIGGSKPIPIRWYWTTRDNE